MEREQRYGLVASAVRDGAHVVHGRFGHQIPPAFSTYDYLDLLSHGVYPDYYQALIREAVEVRPLASYVLVIVTDPRSGRLILFDYSCTYTRVDGPAYRDPQTYRLDNMDDLDPCRR